MLSILDRYFLRELAQTILATAAVLLLIVAGSAFSQVLQRVANGSFPASVMFQVLGLQMVDGLTNLLPAAGFIGVITGLARMYRESEMHVLSSSGMGPRGVLRPVVMLAVSLVLLSALVSLWLGPLAVRTSDTLVAAANRSVIAAGLDAGRFTELPGKGGIIFVDAISRDGSVLGKTLLVTERKAKGGQAQLKLITGERGRLYQETDGSNRFLALEHGWQYEIPLGTNDWRRMQYKRNDAALSNVQADDDETPEESMTTAALTRSSEPPARAELAWRFNAPVMMIVLLLLAIPLSRQSPREPRYGRLLLALASFYAYYVMLALGRAQISKGHWHNMLPLVLIHLLVLALAGWLLWQQHAVRRPRSTAVTT